MDALGVDTTAVRALAATVHALAGEAEALAAGATPAAVPACRIGPADPVVAAALAAFLDAWRPCLRELGADTRRLADALELAARAYQDAELALAGVASGLGR